MFDQTIRANILFGVSEDDVNEGFLQQSLEALQRTSQLGGGGAESSPEKKKAYNPGRYVRVSKESNFDADLFANRAAKRDARCA